MFKPDDPVETKYFQELIDQAFVQFKQVVTEGRGERPQAATGSDCRWQGLSGWRALRLG